jgi:ribosomal protein L11 methyltransferase
VEPRYPFIVIDVASGEVDEMSALLFELGAAGVEERDEQTLVRGAGPGRVTLAGSFESREAADAAIEELQASHPSLGARLEEVVGDAWRDAWKEHFAPFLITPRVRVVPPWVAGAQLGPGEMKLELEPGRAFGTGLHPTTALVAEMLHDRAADLAGREVLDVGTGSGILAFVALLYGASGAVAIDTDDEVIEVVLENAERNGLSSRITASACGVEAITRPFPYVLANIEARVLKPLMPELVRVLAPSGTLILSGILESERDEMVRLYTSSSSPSHPRLTHIETRARQGSGDEGWVALAFAGAS